MTRNPAILTLLTILLATTAAAQRQSPPAKTELTLNGNTISVTYGAPSVRGRQIFGPGGLLSRDPTYPAWRAGANSATAFHTDAPIQINNLRVPAGDYTLYVWVEDPDAWQLIVSKQTGQWGLTYNPNLDLGRTPMTMSKPPALVETYKVTLTATGTNTAELKLQWENHTATVPIALDAR